MIATIIIITIFLSKPNNLGHISYNMKINLGNSTFVFLKTLYFLL